MFTNFKYFIRRLLGTRRDNATCSYDVKWNDNYSSSTSDRPSPSFNTHPITIRVYNAVGGAIVETSMFNSSKDQSVNSLHIITADKSLGSELEKIITMQYLRS